jgi:hypothetical protein
VDRCRIPCTTLQRGASNTQGTFLQTRAKVHHSSTWSKQYTRDFSADESKSDTVSEIVEQSETISQQHGWPKLVVHQCLDTVRTSNTFRCAKQFPYRSMIWMLFHHGPQFVALVDMKSRNVPLIKIEGSDCSNWAWHPYALRAGKARTRENRYQQLHSRDQCWRKSSSVGLSLDHKSHNKGETSVDTHE